MRLEMDRCWRFPPSPCTAIPTTSSFTFQEDPPSFCRLICGSTMFVKTSMHSAPTSWNAGGETCCQLEVWHPSAFERTNEAACLRDKPAKESQCSGLLPACLPACHNVLPSPRRPKSEGSPLQLAGYAVLIFQLLSPPALSLSRSLYASRLYFGKPALSKLLLAWLAIGLGNAPCHVASCLPACLPACLSN